MLKALFNFGYKRSKLEALGFCIVFFAVGSAIAIAMGALEYFLFSGHKYRHVISGGRFIAIIEIWILSYLIINAKRLYKSPTALLLMVLSTAVCIFSSILSWVLLGVLTTLSPPSADSKSDGRMAALLFRSVAILVPAGFLVYDFFFVGMIPAIGIDSARTVSYIVKHPDAITRRDEIAAVQGAYSKVRFAKTKETALKGYEFAVVCAKYGRYYDTQHLLEEINLNDLDPTRRNIAERLKANIQKITDRPTDTLMTFAGGVDIGYSNENSTSGLYARKAGDFKSAAEYFKKSFETIGGNQLMTGFDLVDTLKETRQYQDALYVIDQMISDVSMSPAGLENMNTKKNEILGLGPGAPDDGHYHERYEKFKAYKSRYQAVRKLDPSKIPPDEIITQLLQLQEITPTIVDLVKTRAYLAHIYVEAKQYDKALGEIAWLKENLAKANDRLVKYLPWYEDMIVRKKNGTENSPDPVKEEISRLVSLK